MTRLANIELYRLLMMALVVLTHLNADLTGGGYDFNAAACPSGIYVAHTLIQNISKICVNGFLILSGWFGVLLSCKKIFRLWVALVFVYLPSDVATTLYGGTISVWSWIADMSGFLHNNWYVQNYLLLMVVAPAINAFVENNKRSLWYAIGLLLAEICWDIASGSARVVYFDHGFSPVHFIVVYFIARSLAVRKEALMRIPSWKWFSLYVLGLAVSIALSFSGFSYGVAYTNPALILEAFSLLMLFYRCAIESSLVLKLSSGAFYVFLIHTTNPWWSALAHLNSRVLNGVPYPAYFVMMIFASILITIVCATYGRFIEKVFSPRMESGILKLVDRLMLYSRV